MAKQKIRVTTVAEVTIDNKASASFILEHIVKEQSLYTEGGWSLEEAGMGYKETITAEFDDD